MSAYFLSDAHIGAPISGFENRERHLCRFLDSLVDKASSVYLLGDVFDFWIEYGELIRGGYFHTLASMYNLVKSGVEVHYLAGNHDFALGDFLSEHIGVTVHRSCYRWTLQGKRLCALHGDGLLKCDAGYRLLKPILRSGLNQRLYKMLHPAIGLWLANGCSGASRKYLGALFSKEKLAGYRQAAYEYLKDADIVVFGHTHHAELIDDAGKIYCNTGEWIRQMNYAVLEDGKMSLWNHSPDGQDVQLSPVDWKWGASES